MLLEIWKLFVLHKPIYRVAEKVNLIKQFVFVMLNSTYAIYKKVAFRVTNDLMLCRYLC